MNSPLDHIHSQQSRASALELGYFKEETDTGTDVETDNHQYSDSINTPFVLFPYASSVEHIQHLLFL